MSTATPSVPATARPTVYPVAIHNNPVSKTVSSIRPVVLLGLLAFRFNALVQDPVDTLYTALPVVAAVQATYAVCCLPFAGSHLASKKARPGERFAKHAATGGPNPIVTSILALLLAGVLTPFVHVLFILFGAPFLDHVENTFLCAAHFSVLGLFPIFYARGVNGQALLALAGAYAPLDETFGGFLGAVLGAWLGAVPIPLDWDRDWQKWPVTIIVGMYIGYGIGARVIGSLFFGKRLGSSDSSFKDE